MKHVLKLLRHGGDTGGERDDDGDANAAVLTVVVEGGESGDHTRHLLDAFDARVERFAGAHSYMHDQLQRFSQSWSFYVLVVEFLIVVILLIFYVSIGKDTHRRRDYEARRTCTLNPACRILSSSYDWVLKYHILSRPMIRVHYVHVLSDMK